MHAGNIEILAYDDTPLGLLCLRRRELLGDPGTFVTEITLNHEFLMSSLNTASELALATLAIEEQGKSAGDLGRSDSGKGASSDSGSISGLRVLVGGLGLGYTAQAALASERVARVDVIELLPPVIEWLAEGLVPLSEELNREERLHIIEGDAYEHLLSPPLETYDVSPKDAGPYDVILIDIDHSPDDRLESLARASDRFYTEAGLEAVKRHLAPGGVLAVWSYEESSPFAEVMRNSFEVARFEPVTFENLLIDQEQTDWVFLGRDANP